MSSTKWVVAPPPSHEMRDLAEKLHVSVIMASILASRIPSPDVESAQKFLRPNLSALYSPWDLRDMDKAAERLASAVKNNEKIVVYGDYDTDGVTASAVLITILEALGCPAGHYLPSRMEEGYGVSDDFVAMAQEEGVNLVVTVDCGTHDKDQVETLQKNGVDVIVTDHHEPGNAELPNVTAVVNPKRTDSEYGFRELTGAGVAFKLAWATCEKVVGVPKVGSKLQSALISLLPFVAIGTIADVGPLVSENRVYVVHGLEALSSPLPGMKALIQNTSASKGRVTPRDVAFGIAPRLNAAGRMGNAKLALEVLLEKNSANAEELCRRLEKENQARQKICQEMQEEARQQVIDTHDLEKEGAIVVCHEGWHEGVIGIVASRLVDEFGKPSAVIAVSKEDNQGKGSARSIDGLNLYEAINCSRERLISFGGHEGAAGFRISGDEIATFRKELSENCLKQIKTRNIESTIEIDAELDFSDLGEALAREIELLAPFGHGNERPCFLARGIRVAGEPQLLGAAQKHFSFNASRNGVAFRSVVFNNIQWFHEIADGTRHWDIVFSFSFNDFYSPARLELHIKDMRPCTNA